MASGTLVGLLPPPPPLTMRRYRPNVNTFVWATVFLWGIVYLAHLDPPVWYGTTISLFIVKNVEEEE